MAKGVICRRARFCAAHRLHNPAWGDKKNQEVFGKCNNPHFHGHNYELIVRIQGDIDPETGYIFDAKELRDLVHRHVVADLDHKNLNLDVAEFRQLNPTAENIAKTIYERLRDHIDASFKVHITLYETENNFVEYPFRAE